MVNNLNQDNLASDSSQGGKKKKKTKKIRTIKTQPSPSIVPQKNRKRGDCTHEDYGSIRQ